MRSREAQPPLRSAGGRPRYVRRRAAGYRSDYDILVIASTKKLAEPQYWDKATDRLLWDKGVSTPVGLIVHGAREVNNFVADGQEFFVDVLHEGVVLYEIDDGARYAAVKVVGANAINRRFLQRRRAARMEGPRMHPCACALMRPGISDAAGCIDGFTRHNLSACGSLLSVNSGDLPVPDINRSPLVTSCRHQ